MNDHGPSKELIEENEIVHFYVELEKVKDSDRSLILITNGFLELLIESLIRKKCKRSKKILKDNRSFPYSSKLMILNELDIISDEHYHNLDLFRKLRNRAAHEPFFSVQDDALDSFTVPRPETLDKVMRLCLSLISNTWIENQDVLAPMFAPFLENKNTEQSAAHNFVR